MKKLALLFAALLVAIVVAADTGHLPPALRALYHFPNGDRVGHVVLYGILAFLLAAEFPRPIRLGRLAVPRAIVVLVLLAAAEEYSQRFFPWRTSDVVDLACSVGGIVAGTALARLRVPLERLRASRD